MVNSMTGFATLNGQDDPFRWVWDLRSVNARGLDVRVRVPDWIAGLEQAVRAGMTGAIARGNVTISLRISRVDTEVDTPFETAALESTLKALKTIQDAADAQGVALTPPSPAEILNLRLMSETASSDTDTTDLLAALKADIPQAIAALNEMRAAEGAALLAILAEQLDQIETLIARAGTLAEARKDQWQAILASNLARVLENTDGADADRVAQELAVITVKADVTEELDRLRAHIVAACDHLAGTKPIGRKLDFLMQEFNREANTLCSKSQSKELTALGLDLKTRIDQMREQVQNVE